MQTQPEEARTHVLLQLDQALENGTIAANYREWAAKLRDRLRSPVQVIVIGRPSVGKSTLLDALLGQSVLRGMEGTPEIHVVHGQTARCYAEYFDSRSEWRSGVLSEQRFDQPVARACQELPDASLAEHNLIEIGLPDGSENAAHILAQASASADILIWCSPGFSPQDRQLLSRVPDRLRDHAFLVLTKADVLRKEGRLTPLVEAITATIPEDFLGLYPVSPGAPGDTGLDSQRLKLTLHRQIELGRAADLDQARMILRQVASPSIAAARVPTRAPQPKPVAKSGRTTESDAARILCESGRDLLTQLDQADRSLSSSVVMEHCKQTLDTLSELLIEERAGQSAQDLVEEGQEMLLLIQLEKGKNAPQDAVTLLLQLRRELSVLEDA